MDSYQEIVIAVIERAALDYQDNYTKLLKKTNVDDALRNIAELKDFFNSEFFASVVSIDADVFIKKLEKLADDNIKRHYRARRFPRKSAV